MIKRTLLLILPVLLMACSAPKEQPKAPLDIKAVQEYNAKVYTGNTVPPSERMKSPKQVDIPVNQSDKQLRKNAVRVTPNIAVGYGFGSCHHRYCW